MTRESDVAHLRSPEVARQVAHDIEMRRLGFARLHGLVLKNYITIMLGVYLATLIAIPLGLIPIGVFMDVVALGSLGLLALIFGGFWVERLLYKK
jgi:hypothetical protein